MQRVTIFTDGACRKNPGPGGWAALLMYQGRQRVLSGSAPSTTNNRMELMAANRRAQCTKTSLAVELFTDSEYLRKGIRNWLPRWKRRGFRTIDGSQLRIRTSGRDLSKPPASTKLNGSGSGATPANDLMNSETGLPKKPSRMGQIQIPRPLEVLSCSK